MLTIRRLFKFDVSKTLDSSLKSDTPVNFNLLNYYKQRNFHGIVKLNQVPQKNKLNQLLELKC